MRVSGFFASIAWALLQVGCGGSESNATNIAGGSPSAEGNSGGATVTMGGASTCMAGNERCDCYDNLTCNGDLECRSGLCVARATGGTSGAGGSPNPAGGANTAGTATGGAPNGGQPADSADGLVPMSADVAATLAQGSCVGWSAEPEMGPTPVLEFLIDASGSMLSDPADPSNPAGPNKWTVIAQTMPAVFDSLPNTFAVGAVLYNLPGASTYVGKQAVPIAPLGAPGSAQRVAIDNSINMYMPNGYTPTFNAWEFGSNQLVNFTPVAGYGLSPKYVVLLTDGVPTVDRDGRTSRGSGITQAEYDWQIAQIQMDGAAAGIKTFVIGVVGSENPQGATYDPLYMLSKLAVAGGTAAPGCVPSSGVPQANNVNPRGTYCHMDLSQASDLSTAIKQAMAGIAVGLNSCEFTIPAPPAGMSIEPAKTAVIYNDGAGGTSLILQNTSGTCDKGWVFSDSMKTKLHLCDATCNVIRAHPKATLNLVFGCALGSI